MQEGIIKYYPQILRNIKEIQQIANVEDCEFAKLKEEMATVLKNMFISTANEEGVHKFENMLGIVPKTMQTLNDRKILIMAMMNRRKLSISEIRAMLEEYSGEIEVNPDYDLEELIVKGSDEVSNISTIYKILDELISMQVYIRFDIESLFLIAFYEMPGELHMETTISWWRAPEEWYLDGSVQLNGSHLLNAACGWRLDGTVLLDGSRLLNAVEWKRSATTELEMESNITTIVENFENMELTAQRNLWFLDGAVLLDGSRLLNAAEYKEAI